MKTFLLFLAVIIALFIFLANLGPLILFAAGVALLYVIFKQFLKTDSAAAKVMWVILGLIVLSMTLSNVYALIGVAALYGLYLIFKQGKDDVSFSEKSSHAEKSGDPFTNFERQWNDLNKQ